MLCFTVTNAFLITTTKQKTASIHTVTTANQSTEKIQKVPVSNVTVSGSTTDVDPTGGELAINNILFSGTKTATENLLGDADLDSKITVMDATLVQRHVAKDVILTDTAFTLADVDSDKKLTVMDATQIQRYVAKMINEFKPI